jgi:membrane-bound lytic murein transglycosylase F
MVAEQEIEITIADSNVALLNRRYYPETRMIFSIENKQSLGWAVRKEHPELLKEINNFFNIIKENGTFDEIYNRYYAGINIFNYLDLQKFSERLETRLPKYKALIKRESKKCGFDWLLIAATIYQESYFQPNAKSYTGVR